LQVEVGKTIIGGDQITETPEETVQRQEAPEKTKQRQETKQRQVGSEMLRRFSSMIWAAF